MPVVWKNMVLSEQVAILRTSWICKGSSAAASGEGVSVNTSLTDVSGVCRE